MIRLVNDYTFKSFKKYTGPNQEEQFKQKKYFLDIMVKVKQLYQKEL